MSELANDLEKTRDFLQKANVNLEDLIPQASVFELAKTGKTYRVRPISLEDEVWLAETFGPSLQRLLTEVNFAALARIAFHQMELEDQKEFLAKDVEIVNDEGEKATVRIGGYKLLLGMLSGRPEKDRLCTAVLETFGISRPIVERLEKKILEEQATALAAEGKSPVASRSTGPKRLTSSPPNTAGRPKRSAG